MSINDYEEKNIRNNIIKKVNPVIKGGRKHSKGYIYIDDKLVTKVKIPNHHNRIMKKSKSSYIATALRLEPQEFNDLIDCVLTGPGYYKLLQGKIKPKA